MKLAKQYQRTWAPVSRPELRHFSLVFVAADLVRNAILQLFQADREERDGQHNVETNEDRNQGLHGMNLSARMISCVGDNTLRQNVALKVTIHRIWGLLCMKSRQPGAFGSLDGAMT